MKILAQTRRLPGATFEKISALQIPEVSMVWEMMKGDFIREIYFDKDKPAVTLVVEAESIQAATRRLSGLPMVTAGLLAFDFTVLGPYRQIEVLFGREK